MKVFVSEIFTHANNLSKDINLNKSKLKEREWLKLTADFKCKEIANKIKTKWYSLIH